MNATHRFAYPCRIPHTVRIALFYKRNFQYIGKLLDRFLGNFSWMSTLKHRKSRLRTANTRSKIRLTESFRAARLRKEKAQLF